MKLIPPNITPGPWKESLATISAVSHGRWFRVAKADCRELTDAGNCANARAIAAIPDTLAALADLLRIYHGQTTAKDGDELAPFLVDEVLAMEKARDALLKAGYQLED